MGSRETEGGVNSLETRSRTAIGVWLVTSPSLCPDIWLTGRLTALGYVSFLLVHRLLHTSTQAYPARWVGVGEAKTSMLIYYKYSTMNLSFPKTFLDLCVSVPTCAGGGVLGLFFFSFGPDEAGNLVVLVYRKGRSSESFLFSILFIYF